MKTDLELQLALAKMLPEEIEIYHQKHGLDPRTCFFWRDGQGRQIVDESWLHVCWLIEQELTIGQSVEYVRKLHPKDKGSPLYDDFYVAHTSWQQRATALIAVKGEK